jgi:plastocyanin
MVESDSSGFIAGHGAMVAVSTVLVSLVAVWALACGSTQTTSTQPPAAASSTSVQSSTTSLTGGGTSTQAPATTLSATTSSAASSTTASSTTAASTTATTQPATTTTGPATTAQPTTTTAKPAITTVTSTTTTSQPTTTLAAATFGIDIQGFAFSPSSLTIGVGDRVVWTNNDAAPHTVTADDGSFTSPDMPTGGTFSYRFTHAGTYSYHCSIHPSMKGTITVK